MNGPGAEDRPRYVCGYDDSNGKDYTAATVGVYSAGSFHVLMTAIDNLSPALRRVTTELQRFYYMLARSCAPRVAHLAYFAKKARTRKKNKNRLRKEISKAFPPEPKIRPLAVGRIRGYVAERCIFDEYHDRRK